MNKYLLLLFVFLVSCNFPEHYFTEAPACAKELYSTEKTESQNINQSIILEKLRATNSKEFRYFFKTFIESEKNTYMLTSFAQNDDCFLVKILVDKWDKLGGMRRTNGVSYSKELFDLKWTITTVDGKEEIVFMDMHKIID